MRTLADLRREWGDCQRCDLSKTRTKLVFGDGNPNAHIMVIGEGPGATEDMRGLPFKGDAGEILDEFLEQMMLDRDRDLYVTNVICCRATADSIDDRTGKLKTDNRPPTRPEREACIPRLLETIYLVDPLLIITIGKVPFQALFGRAPKMAALRGRMQTFHLEGRHVKDLRYTVLPMYHTAFLLRTHDKRHEGPWGRTLVDWAKACSVIDYLREAYFGIPQPDRSPHAEDGGKEKLRRKRS